ncbi:MAG: Aldehyde ferredoxin oxidoreductase [uncultured bacterium]|nr:MAG: Aldehyde ferredoxin oxidoreductase [uncultured bacterium]
MIASKSPAGNLINYCFSKGKFGTSLKASGFDGILIHGKSETPAGIEIYNQSVKFTPAEGFTGLTNSKIKAKLGNKVAYAAYGTGAENDELSSNILFDDLTSAGRGGVGLVWKAKNIKYISVTGDAGKLNVFDKNKLEVQQDKMNLLIDASPFLSGEFGMKAYGSGALMDLLNKRNMLPVNDFQETNTKDIKKINAPSYKNNLKLKTRGCELCSTKEVVFSKRKTTIPDFNSMVCFSTLINNYEKKTVLENLDICHENGLDAVSWANGISKYNKKTIAKEIKKIPVPPYDLRGSYGLALEMATSTTGGSYINPLILNHEVLRKPVPSDRFSFAGKARLVKYAQTVLTVFQSLVLCDHIIYAVPLELIMELINAVTGENKSINELLKTGETILDMERKFNQLNGFSMKDDAIPEIFFNRTAKNKDGSSSKPIKKSEFKRALKEYYQLISDKFII